MFSKITKALILSGCLVAAGTASANGRDMIVPVIAGAAVGAVLATVISGSSHDNYRPQYQGYQPQPRYQPRYQQQYQPVTYVPVAQRVVYQRFDPQPPRGHYNGGYDRGHDRGFDRNRGDGRW